MEKTMFLGLTKWFYEANVGQPLGEQQVTTNRNGR